MYYGIYIPSILPDGFDDNLCSLFFLNKVLKIIEDLPIVYSICFKSPPIFSGHVYPLLIFS